MHSLYRRVLFSQPKMMSEIWHILIYLTTLALTYKSYPLITRQIQKQYKTQIVFSFIISNSVLLIIQIFNINGKSLLFDFNLYGVFLLLLVMVPIIELNFIVKRFIVSTIIITSSFVLFFKLDFPSLLSKSCYLGALVSAVFSGYKTSEQVINTYFMITINDDSIIKIRDRLAQSVDLQFEYLKRKDSNAHSHQKFINNLFSEYDELLLLRDQNGFSWFGLLFTLFCGFRIVGSIFNLLFTSNDQQQDLVTKILDYIVFKRGYNVNIHAWSRNLSFLIVGMMSISAIQSLLREFRKVSNNFIINSELVILLITHSIGFYFLALLLMIIKSLPPSYQTGPVLVFGNINLVEFSKWFDLWFLIAVVVTGTLYYLYLKSHSNHI